MSLTICPECDKDFVIPILENCHQVSDGWHLTLWCAHCYYEREVEVSQNEAEVFDEELDAFLYIVQDDLDLLEYQRLEEENRRFVAALEADAILPEDFR